MAHALAAFITQRMDELHLRQRDVVTASGLSRAVVSKYAADERPRLGRLPERETLAGLAKALHVPVDVLVGKAVEALDLGYSSGDFVSTVADASNEELVTVILDRLNRGGGAHAGSAAPIDTPGSGPDSTAVDLLVRRYLKQAGDDPAEASRLLAHDGAAGANADKDVWNAGLARLDAMPPKIALSEAPGSAVASEGEGDPGESAEADRRAAAAKAKQQEAIEEMEQKKRERESGKDG